MANFVPPIIYQPNTRLFAAQLNDTNTALQLSINNIDQEQLNPASIGQAQMQNNSVNTLAIIDGAITNQKIGLAAVENDNLAAGAVTEPKIADSAVTTDKLRGNAVTVVQGQVNKGEETTRNDGYRYEVGPITVNAGAYVQIMCLAEARDFGGSPAWGIAIDIDTNNDGTWDLLEQVETGLAPQTIEASSEYTHQRFLYFWYLAPADGQIKVAMRIKNPFPQAPIIKHSQVTAIVHKR